jgi:hypothetical protein
MKKIGDRITLGITAGFVGNLAKTLGNLASHKIGTSKILYGQFAAGIFGTVKDVKRDKITIGVGQLIDTVVYSGLGIPLTYILSKTGKDNHLLKGAGWELLTSIIFYGVTPKLGITNMLPQKGAQHLAAMINHLGYGLLTAESIVRLGDPEIFPEHNKDVLINDYVKPVRLAAKNEQEMGLTAPTLHSNP